MGAFFHTNNKIFSFLSNIADMIILNLLWMLCCIPIITIVPATAAMYYVTLKIVRQEDPYIIRSFFHSFRENFKQGILLSVIFLILAGILYVDVQLFISKSHQVLLMISCAVCVIVITTVAYVCPFLSHFHNTVATTLKNSFIIGFSNPLKTVIILITDLLPILLLLFFPELFSLSIPFWFMLGFATIALVNSVILSQIFAKYEPNKPTEE